MSTSRILASPMRLCICFAILFLNQQVALSQELRDETPKISSRRNDGDRKGQDPDGLFRSKEHKISIRFPKGWSVETPVHPDVFAKAVHIDKSARKAVVTVDQQKDFFSDGTKWPLEPRALFARLRRKSPKDFREEFVSGGTKRFQAGMCVWMTTKMTAPLPLLIAKWYFRRGDGLIQVIGGTNFDAEWFDENRDAFAATAVSLRFLDDESPAAVKESDLKRRIRELAKVRAKAMLSKDFDTAIEFMPQSHIKQIGGKEAAKKMLRKSYASMELDLLAVHEVSSLSQEDDLIWLAVVPTTTVIRRYRDELLVDEFKKNNPDEALPKHLVRLMTMEGYDVGMSQNRGKSWKFDLTPSRCTSGNERITRI